MAMARWSGRDRRKEWYWRRVLRQWRRSGQTVRSYCLEHVLSEPLVYAWRRTVRERDEQAGQSPCSRGQAKAQAKARAGPCPGDGFPAFVPVMITAATPSLEVALANGRVVRVPAGFDPATLRQLLAILDQGSPC